MKKVLSLFMLILAFASSIAFADVVAVQMPYNTVEQAIAIGSYTIPLIILATIMVTVMSIIIFIITKKDELHKKAEKLLNELLFLLLSFFLIALTINNTFKITHTVRESFIPNGFMLDSDSPAISSIHIIAKIFGLIQLTFIASALIVRYNKKSKKTSITLLCLTIFFIFLQTTLAPIIGG